MSREAWENRFRDSAHVAIWQRWQNAREAWRKGREHTPFKEGGPDMFFNPVPALVTDPVRRAEAQEFQDARAAYHAEIKSTKFAEETA